MHTPRDGLIGRTIGNYVVRGKLGEGGMGAVYLTEHPAIGKKVALKVLHPEYASRPEIVERFFHEAKAVNDIQHPNIVDVHDFGVLGAAGESIVYFIMEYLVGCTLTDVIRREGALAPARAFAIGSQIADALAAAHRQGIVHRDLKPDNVMLIQRGRAGDFVKLLDFGIAKLTGDKGQGPSRTRTGMLIGTPAYMSPEQCQGRGEIDHRTDIYALGVVLYELVTGHAPFEGEGYGEVLVQHLTRAPIAPSALRHGIPAEVERVVLTALEKAPAARYQSMDEMAAAMSGAAGALGGPWSSGSVRSTAPHLPSSPAIASASTTLGGSASELSATPPSPSRRGLFGGIAIATAIAAGAIAAVIASAHREAGGGSVRASAPAAAPAREPMRPAPPAPAPAPPPTPAPEVTTPAVLAHKPVKTGTGAPAAHAGEGRDDVKDPFAKLGGT